MKAMWYCALLLVSTGVQAQTWLPPHEAVHAALDAQASVMAARARLEAAQANARALHIGPHEFQLDVVSQRRTSTEMGGAERFSEAEITLSRAFRWPGKAKLDRDIGAAESAAAEQRLEDVRHQMARQLLDDWMMWLRAAEASQRTGMQALLMDAAQRTLARRVALGDAAQKDLDLLEVERAQAQAAQLAAQAALETARLTIKSDFPSLPIPESMLEVDVPQGLPGTAAAWVERILASSHELGALESDAHAADARADRLRADRMADPTLGLRRLKERGGSEQVTGIVLSIPLGGSQRSALATAEGSKAAALHGDVAVMRRTINTEAVRAVLRVTHLVAQWRARRAALDASAAASLRVKRGWELGETALSEWLLVQRQHSQIVGDEAAARLDAEEARLRVLVDAHALWHDDQAHP
ncbi:MAG: TolC family protein [Sterolibacterium sp.]|nr:TolC family protein [Sterolibacterium sp.]